MSITPLIIFSELSFQVHEREGSLLAYPTLPYLIVGVVRWGV